MFAKAAVLLTAAAGLAAAYPAATTTDPSCDSPSKTTTLTGVTHSVVAGLGGLHFDPDNVVAQVGDIVEWHFLPKNHSVAQSSFGSPCKPILDADNSTQTSFFSGFQPIADGQAPDVFQIVVTDSNPIWYYCAQTNGGHCQAGMAGVINQNFNSQTNTLANYKKAAALTGVSVIPSVIEGGEVIPNPNPNGGF